MVLEWLQKYDSIEKQENSKEYVMLHTGIKGLHFSHGISALAILMKGVSKIGNFKFLNKTKFRTIFMGSAFIGISASQALSWHRLVNFALQFYF